MPFQSLERNPLLARRLIAAIKSCKSKIWNSFFMESCMPLAISISHRLVLSRVLIIFSAEEMPHFCPDRCPKPAEKNSYIVSGKAAHLVDCLFDFSTRLKHPEPRNHFQVLVEALPQGEWHFVRLLWLAGFSLSVSLSIFPLLRDSLLLRSLVRRYGLVPIALLLLFAISSLQVSSRRRLRLQKMPVR